MELSHNRTFKHKATKHVIVQNIQSKKHDVPFIYDCDKHGSIVCFLF